MNTIVKLMTLGLGGSVTGTVALFALFAFAPVDASANTNPCNDSEAGGEPSALIQHDSDGSYWCYPVPSTSAGESYDAAFLRVYGFYACDVERVLVEDGSCVADTFFTP